MEKNRPARLTIRVSPQLHFALVRKAAAAGRSLNAYIAEVLAAACARDANFTLPVSALTPDATPEQLATAAAGEALAQRAAELRALPRRPNGDPVPYKERFRHLHAKQRWVERHKGETGMWERMHEYEKQEPWFFVEWSEALDREQVDQQRAG